MTYDLDAVYVVSLGLLVGLVVMPVRQWADAAAAKHGLKVSSFVWGWAAMALSMLLVVPVLITKGAAFNWRLLAAAYTEGLPVGAVAIVAYDLGLKPLKRFGGFLVEALKRWILSSTDKGGLYSGYGYGSGYPGLGGLGEGTTGEDGGLVEEESQDVPGAPPRRDLRGLGRGEQGGSSEGPP